MRPSPLIYRHLTKEIIVDFNAGLITFREFLIEKLIPRKIKEIKIEFNEIGRNSFSHRYTCSASLEAFEILETTKGRIWIPSRFRKEKELFEILDECWKSNKKEKKEKNEYRTFRKQLSRTEPVTLVIGLVLLLSMVFFTIYFNLKILPKLEI